MGGLRAATIPQCSSAHPATAGAMTYTCVLQTTRCENRGAAKWLRWEAGNTPSPVRRRDRATCTHARIPEGNWTQWVRETRAGKGKTTRTLEEHGTSTLKAPEIEPRRHKEKFDETGAHNISQAINWVKICWLWKVLPCGLDYFHTA